MQTKREYAHSLGLAKMGRGKFSAAAKAAIAKAEAEGVVFAETSTGVPVLKPVIEEGGNTDTPSAPVVKASDSLYLTPSEFRYPEADYVAYIVRDQKKVEVSLRECCNLCRVSLVGHACEQPTIHGNIAVSIERR